ncbi:MAG: undecaprenyldiphospho-muramoylpentapeptide beta-N-acetylglucosaminyltransferase [Treponema sp.]|jgi:UDP-N-acetylglucosamine--N-acetylmuramyl-(pentapeptide) pyrophosphoryl-undecaprenol N-acetylglucosamine transferase|nr:undecaprenyldiphospho-muramoylpentapeptide beta-N-acetylglucosaminyltransferase [Treponema sp.]
MRSIVFSGGGSGGHIYPGLAVAARIKKLRVYRVFWIGQGTGMDRSIVENEGIEFYGIPAGRFRRYFSFKTIPDFFRVIAGFFAARRILKREKPALLFSKGGFVSVPPCVAAASLKIPVYTHESDISPGLATKINARCAAFSGGRIFTAYKETSAFFPEALRSRIIVSGQPVRNSFRKADSQRGKAFLGAAADERILLVLGGSQGAQELNELVKGNLDALTRYYTVIHQTGPKNQWDLKKGSRYRSYAFIGKEMPDVLAAAELVLGRSGAGTVWECAVTGKPMILIPLAGSGTRGDQVENARYFEKAGAALVLYPAAGEGLVSAVGELHGNEAKRNAMAAASRRIGEKDAASLIAGSLSRHQEKIQ